MKIKLPLKTRILWQIRLSVLFIIIIGAVAAFTPLTAWMLLPSAVLFALALIFLFWYVPAFFKSYEILIENGTVIINRGVFIKTTYIMPFPRLVFAQKVSTIVSSRLRLCAVALKAARGFVIIPEMELSDAERLLMSLAGD